MDHRGASKLHGDCIDIKPTLLQDLPSLCSEPFDLLSFLYQICALSNIGTKRNHWRLKSRQKSTREQNVQSFSDNIGFIIGNPETYVVRTLLPLEFLQPGTAIRGN